MVGGEVVEVGAGAVLDARVIRLSGIDDVRARLAAEDLEGKVLRVPLCAGDVARGYGGRCGL